MKYLPQTAGNNFEANIETSRKSWLGSRLNTLGAEVKTLKSVMAKWIMNMNVKIPKNRTNMQFVDLSGRTIRKSISGLLIAYFYVLTPRHFYQKIETGFSVINIR